nr:ATP-binding protein [Caballeronia sp. AZ7_KS35]
MKPDFDVAGIQLEAAVPEASVLIRGDTARIEEIVWNLLSNAMKFTPRGGQVKLQVRQSDDKVRLEVADTGCGIPTDSLKSVVRNVSSGTERTPSYKSVRTRHRALAGASACRASWGKR